jgi:uncharacterized coiled-coil DUF342 family protein
MQPLSLERRVTNLEQKVETLKTLPDRITAVELQISEFRTEVRAEFSATRARVDAIDGRFDEVRAEMRALNDETKAHMRALHEDVIDRITRIGECRKPANGRRKRSQ